MANGPTDEEVAVELAISWMNGNHKYVAKEISEYNPLSAAYVALLLCDQLPPREQKHFAGYLKSKI